MTVNITIDGFTFSAENNGDCYITDTKPTFPVEPFTVTITADDPVYSRVYQNAEIIEPYSNDGRYWFAFRELSAEEIKAKETEATIQLLTDCLLEMSETVYA